MQQTTPPTNVSSSKPDLPVAMPPAGKSRSRRAMTAAGRSFKAQPAWKKMLLVLAIVFAITGLVGVTVGAFREKPVEQQQAAVTIEDLQTEQSRANLTPEQREKINTQINEAKQTVSQLGHWFYDKTAPNLWRWGLSFAVMFMLGFMFRQFLKTMATLAAIVLVGAGVAAYLGYVDLANVKDHLAQGTGWMMDRMGTVKENVVKFLGASLVGTAGFVIGFLRR